MKQRSDRTIDDLNRLVGRGGTRRDEGEMDMEDDMPPLLQALTRSPKHDDARQAIDKKLKELEEREKKRAMEDWYICNLDILNFLMLTFLCVYSGSLGGLVVSKSHACYLLEGAGWDWVRIPLGSNFSGSASGVSGHA